MTMKEHGSYVTVYENVQLALALKEEEKKVQFLQDEHC